MPKPGGGKTRSFLGKTRGKSEYCRRLHIGVRHRKRETILRGKTRGKTLLGGG